MACSPRATSTTTSGTTSASRPATPTPPRSAARRSSFTSATQSNAIANGLCEVALITHGQAGRSSRVPIPARPQPALRHVRDALRHDRHAHQLRHGRHPLHARLRRGPCAPGDGRDRRLHPQVGPAQPQGDDARPHDVRRLPRLALDSVALPPAGLLPRHRRGRGHRRHVRGARPQPAEAARLRARPRGAPRPRRHHDDARPHRRPPPAPPAPPPSAWPASPTTTST